MTRPRHRLAATVLVTLALVVPAGVARAHTEVQRSEPQPGTQVTAPVDRVRLTFLDPVLPGATIDVADDAGVTVDGLGPTDLSDDRRVATARFTPLEEAGGYVVDYRFTAEDGDEQRESFRFTVEPAVDRDDGDGARPDARGVVGAVVVGTALAVALGTALRRRAGEK